MRCSGLADVENDDLNAAKCDVLGLRMLKPVFFTVLSCKHGGFHLFCACGC